MLVVSMVTRYNGVNRILKSKDNELQEKSSSTPCLRTRIHAVIVVLVLPRYKITPLQTNKRTNNPFQI